MATSTSKPKTTKRAATKTVSTKAASTEAQEMSVFSMQGKEVGKIALPGAVFAQPWRADLVHQVTTALAANKRQNRAHTKDRSEVRGGGKKPWKQKGTGQARHGSSRSPIWRHGGITFGPRNARDYHEKINRKMKIGALYAALSRKAKDGEVILVDAFTFSKPQTSEAKKALTALVKATDAKFVSKNAALIALSDRNADAVKSFRNMGNVAIEEVRNLNPLTVLSYRYVVIENPEASFKTLIGRK